MTSICSSSSKHWRRSRAASPMSCRNLDVACQATSKGTCLQVVIWVELFCCSLPDAHGIPCSYPMLQPHIRPRSSKRRAPKCNPQPWQGQIADEGMHAPWVSRNWFNPYHVKIGFAAKSVSSTNQAKISCFGVQLAFKTSTLTLAQSRQCFVTTEPTSMVNNMESETEITSDPKQPSPKVNCKLHQKSTCLNTIRKKMAVAQLVPKCYGDPLTLSAAYHELRHD